MTEQEIRRSTLRRVGITKQQVLHLAAISARDTRIRAQAPYWLRQPDCQHPADKEKG